LPTASGALPDVGRAVEESGVANGYVSWSQHWIVVDER